MFLHPRMQSACGCMQGPDNPTASHQLFSEGSAQTCRGYQTFSAPAPAPVAIGETNAMVQRVDTAFAKAQKTPQLSFGQDGVTVQQPVVSFLFLPCTCCGAMSIGLCVVAPTAQSA